MTSIISSPEKGAQQIGVTRRTYCDPVPDGAASQREYVAGQVPGGGPVSSSASRDVRSEITRRGTAPAISTDDRDAPSSTGCRPVCSIERTACSSPAADAGTTRATGWSQSPRMAGPNIVADAESANRTLAEGPIESQSAETAETEPA